MDISKPVGLEIKSVDFGVLSADEVRKLSSRLITNPSVFDSLGHPVNGGLYDLALGAFLKNLCSTCGLDEKFCPGHQGHIELPIPVYNPLFLNQLYLLLRSCCLYCHHFRLNSMEVHRYVCKLRLIQYGLLLECSELDDMVANGVINEQDDDDDSNLKAADPAAKKELRKRREEFVSSAIASAIEEGRSSRHGVHTATVGEVRKATIHDLYRRMLGRPRCDNCGMYSATFRKDGFTKMFENPLKDKQLNANRARGRKRPDMLKKGEQSLDDSRSQDMDQRLVGSKYVMSTEVRNIMRLVFDNEQPLVQKLFHSRPFQRDYVSPDIFFLHNLVVPPTRFRLPSKVGDEVHENAQNELLTNVLKTSLSIREFNDQLSNLEKGLLSSGERKLVFNRLMNSFVVIQNDVNAFIDSTKNQNAPAGRPPIPGIKQALEKKEGLFRKHMMGKRVNYAARSVISPDPMLGTNEIGVPPIFATKLTYPEPVTAYNAAELRRNVINGPEKWPGALQIQNEDGSLISLIGMTLEQRKAVAHQLTTPSSGSFVVNKKVFRHMRNNDVVLMNRQPSLHKASIMGHKVRVLPGEKTLRLHYANTGAYNADFDGDEMNMHLPQNENARSEAFNLANTDSQYLTPTSGSPLRGLIQDHVSAGVWLTNKDTFFKRDAYQQLVYSCIRPEDGLTNGSRIRTLPPAIFKPQQLWTGKQIISTILMNVKPNNVPGVNLNSKNKVKNEYWSATSNENEVIIKNGELLCGVLDKSQFGASQFGLVHSLHEIYGPSVAGKVLTILGRLFTSYITLTAFTCGMDDLRMTAQGDEWRQDVLRQAATVGKDAAMEVANLSENSPNRDKELNKRLEEIIRDDNKSGVLDAVTQSKVGAITSQVVSKCVPAGTMKAFPYNNMQLMALSGAKGSGVNVSQIMCLLGQQALEGRRVPIMVSGKTLPSFKPLDTNAQAGGYIRGRFYSGINPQEYYFHCMAGREGLIDTAVKTSRSGYLQRCLTKQLEGVHVAYDNSVRDGDGSLIQFLYGGDAIDTTKQSHMKQFQFCVANYEAMLSKYNPGDLSYQLDAELALLYSKKVRKHMKKQQKLPHHEQSVKYDPVVSVYNPSKYLGAVSESFQVSLDDFIEKNQHLFSKGHGLSEKKFRALMQLKYMRSVVSPGEPVGIIASQSIGEPSTQMTLNTFHFAGHGAANVTLGIPRMREIIMTASSAIQTPQMTLPLLPDINEEQADGFCKAATKVLLSEFIDKVTVVETTPSSGPGEKSRSYTVKMKLFTKDEYENEYDISQKHLECVLSAKFLDALEAVVTKEIKKQRKSESLPHVGRALSKKQSDPVSTSIEGEEHDDTSDAKTYESKKQAVSYDDDNEPDKEAEATSEEDKGDSDMDSVTSDSSSEDGEEVNDNADDSIKTEAMSRSAKNRQADVLTSHNFISKFNFDDKNGEWCEYKLELPGETEKLLMVNIIEDLCNKVVVREIPRVGRCLRSPESSPGKMLLTTEGVNFQAMWDQTDFLDVNGIKSNDIYAVLKTYGVEAARNTIVSEINNVFDKYAISVSSRHLDLIGDIMTREGTYLAFNRQGIDTSTSPFMKMSFETTCQFLTKAVLNGDTEQLESPSSQIVIGNLPEIGTGTFDVLNQFPIDLST